MEAEGPAAGHGLPGPAARRAHGLARVPAQLPGHCGCAQQQVHLVGIPNRAQLVHSTGEAGGAVARNNKYRIEEEYK